MIKKTIFLVTACWIDQYDDKQVDDWEFTDKQKAELFAEYLRLEKSPTGFPRYYSVKVEKITK